MLILDSKSPSSATVIFLHGFGQTNQSWLPWVQQLAEHLPYVRWILPQAETGPVTYPCPDCPRWFDVHALPPTSEEDDTPTAEVSKQRIHTIIEDVMRDGTPSYSVFLVGFSQGSSVAILAGLTCKHKLGGVGVLAGWLPPKLKEIVHKADSASRPPMFWAHGIDDEEIPLQNALATIQWLRSSLDIEQTGFTFREYPGLKHDVNEEVLRDLSEWLNMI